MALLHYPSCDKVEEQLLVADKHVVALDDLEEQFQVQQCARFLRRHQFEELHLELVQAALLQLLSEILDRDQPGDDGVGVVLTDDSGDETVTFFLELDVLILVGQYPHLKD